MILTFFCLKTFLLNGNELKVADLKMLGSGKYKIAVNFQLKLEYINSYKLNKI
jgi:hypothetical protein